MRCFRNFLHGKHDARMPQPIGDGSLRESTCPCSKICPLGNGSPLKNVAEDFASVQIEHLALLGSERLARVLGAVASSALVTDRNEFSGRNGARFVTMGA
jgi:hypothetical protein